MGERKVLNKYFPPDFDPSKLPKGKRPDYNSMKVRMMLPMSVRCNSCGNFMYKGTKFNCKKQASDSQFWFISTPYTFVQQCCWLDTLIITFRTTTAIDVNGSTVLKGLPASYKIYGKYWSIE